MHMYSILRIHIPSMDSTESTSTRFKRMTSISVVHLKRSKQIARKRLLAGFTFSLSIKCNLVEIFSELIRNRLIYQERMVLSTYR